MGLIEKAARAGVLDAQEGDPASATARPNSTAFDVDFSALEANGFYSRTVRANALSLELRAIKRRLLRRLGFMQRKADKRVFQQAGRARNTVLVTSTRPAEGKTFTAINLALSLACEEEIDILLVDADTPRPKVRAHFGLPQAPGLTDAIESDGRKGDLFAATNLPLSILGEGAPVARADDFFASSQAQRFFTGLSAARSDRLILIDAPPVLATTETSVLARHVDEVVFVIEADATPEPAVAAALDELLDANPNVSLVLNRCLFAGGGSHYGSYHRYETVRTDDAARGAGEGDA
ncbi:MAG: hypothetical protein AAGJ87_00045 [Pseudomonadota bacterium]